MRREESGIVWVDRRRCVGCWMCVLACPFGAVIPSSSRQHATKCDGCRERPSPACLDLCEPRHLALRGHAEGAEVAARRRDFAMAGWAWRGIEGYPAPKPPPATVQTASRPTSRSLHYVIVGGGVAAARAVEAIRRADARGRITVVCAEGTYPYSRVLLPQFLAGRVDLPAMWLHPPSWWDAQGVELLRGDPAVGLEAHSRQVVLASGKALRYDRLLVATGSRPTRQGIAGADLAGVATFHGLGDAEAVRDARPQAAVIVGGGFVALKAAEGLHAMGAAVTLVVRSRLLRRMLDAASATVVERRLRGHGVEVLQGRRVVEVHGQHSRVRGVSLDDGRRLGCDLLVLAAGVQPNVDWLAGSGARVGNGVAVDGRLQTNLPHVWAAGDVAETRDLLAGRPVVNAIWPSASEQGRLAGACMAGEEISYDGSLAMNTLDVFGLPVASFGEVSACGIANAEGNGEVLAHKHYRDGRLVGAVLVGDISEAGRLLAEARRHYNALAAQRLAEGSKGGRREG